MATKRKPDKTQQGDEDKPRSLSSPPCYMEEFAEYFGLDQLPSRAESRSSLPIDPQSKNPQDSPDS